jgi:hypothetical protein
MTFMREEPIVLGLQRIEQLLQRFGTDSMLERDEHR